MDRAGKGLVPHPPNPLKTDNLELHSNPCSKSLSNGLILNLVYGYPGDAKSLFFSLRQPLRGPEKMTFSPWIANIAGFPDPTSER